jgi:hypothetical protein
MKDIEFLLSNCGIIRIEIPAKYGVTVYTTSKKVNYNSLQEFEAFVERCKAQKSK